MMKFVKGASHMKRFLLILALLASASSKLHAAAKPTTNGYNLTQSTITFSSMTAAQVTATTITANSYGMNSGTGTALFGTGAGVNLQSASAGNTVVGYMALSSATATSSNTVVGQNAMYSCATCFGQMTAIGVEALYSYANSNTNNIGVAVGYQAGKGFNGTGKRGTFIGTLAGRDVTTGNASVFLGYGTGLGVTTGDSNTIIGDSAGGTLSASVHDNTAIGASAMSVAGSSNVFIGNGGFTSGGSSDNNNVAIGWNALKTGGLPTFDNVAVGFRSMSTPGIGKISSGNTALGAYSGFQSTGTNCTFLGYKTDVTSTTVKTNMNLTNAAALGALATVGVSNGVAIGSNVVVGINNDSPGRALDVYPSVNLPNGPYLGISTNPASATAIFEVNSTSVVVRSSMNVTNGGNLLINSYTIFSTTMTGVNLDTTHVVIGTATIAAGATLTVTPANCPTLVAPWSVSMYNSAAVAAGSVEFGAYAFGNATIPIINRDATDSKSVIYSVLCR